MRSKYEILVVEDDLVVRSNLEILLTELGHEISGFADNALDAIVLFSTRDPDLVIADIGLPGDVDGIEFAKRIAEIRRVPVVFLTAHESNEVFSRAKSAHPFAFVTKPIDRNNLERVIDLALEHYELNSDNTGGFFRPPFNSELAICECLYTKVGNRLKKIPFSEITHVDVDGKYCGLNRAGNHPRINVKMSLKEIIDRLPAAKFVQVNRNCAVNMDFVEDVEMNNLHITLEGREIQISRVFKDNLFTRMNIV